VTAGPEITTLRLPGSGWLLQWRGDGFWRDLSAGQHQAEGDGAHVPDPDEWVRWTGDPQPQGHGGEWRGVTTWWLLHGELPGATTPTVELTDGTHPPVLLLGRLWACEWHAVAQPVTVRVEGERFELPFAEPHYRRPEPPEDQGHEPRGWFRP
jgi:hypothetical protein